MTTQGTFDKKIRHYSPNGSLVDFMRDRLQLEKQLSHLRGGEKEIPGELSKKTVSLGTQKNRLLNNILFQAMADITFFFKEIGRHDELRKVFDEDIKELLGVKRDLPRSYYELYINPDKPEVLDYGFMFWDLIAGMLLVSTEKDFRLRLIHKLQYIIWQKTSQYLSSVFESTNAQASIARDFTRILGWTEMLMFAMPERDEYRIPDIIPVSRKYGPTKQEKELIQGMDREYQKDLKRNLPNRTFSLVSAEE